MGQQMLAKGYTRETVARAHNALKRHLYSAIEKGYITLHAHHQVNQTASS